METNILDKLQEFENAHSVTEYRLIMRTHSGKKTTPCNTLNTTTRSRALSWTDIQSSFSDVTRVLKILPEYYADISATSEAGNDIIIATGTSQGWTMNN